MTSTSNLFFVANVHLPFSIFPSGFHLFSRSSLCSAVNTPTRSSAAMRKWQDWRCSGSRSTKSRNPRRTLIWPWQCVTLLSAPGDCFIGLIMSRRERRTVSYRFDQASVLANHVSTTERLERTGTGKLDYFQISQMQCHKSSACFLKVFGRASLSNPTADERSKYPLLL